MLKRCGDWFDTPVKRLAGLCAVVALLGSVMRLTAGTTLQGLVPAAFPAAGAVILLRRSWQQWLVARRAFIRQQIRLVGSWHALTARPPIISVAHVYSMALAFGAIALALATRDWTATFAWQIALYALALAGLGDVLVLASRLAAHAWARMTGKLIALATAAALAAISLSVARNIAHAVSHTDSRYLSDFTTVLACCILPVVYIYAVSTLLLIPAICQSLWFSVAAVYNNIFCVPRADEQRSRKTLALWWYRLQHKRWPPGGVLPRHPFFSAQSILRMTAPLSKITLAILLMDSMTHILDGLPTAAPFLSRVLMAMEYKTGNRCAGLEQSPVVYMDDGWVSVAQPGADRVEFTIAKCDYAPQEKPNTQER